MESTLHTQVERKCVSTKHRFKEIPLPQAPPGRDLKLHRDAFQVQYKAIPSELTAISSFKSTLNYWSPRAIDWCVPHADLPMIESAFKHGEVDQLCNAWLGKPCEVRCGFVIRDMHDPAALGDWLLPLCHMTGSSVIAFPL